MGLRALFLRHHHPEREIFPDVDDHELVRFCFKTKTTTNVPPPTATELALQDKQLELATFQLTQLQTQADLQAQFAEQLGPALEQQQLDADAARDQLAITQPIQNELLQLALDDARQGTAATPEQISLIEEAGDAAVERGSTDIERFRTDSLTALREELAPSLGLRPGDTPILDRGSRVAAEATRLGGNLSESVRGAEATAKLNFPLAQGQLALAQTTGASSVSQAMADFQSRLRSAAFSNRLSLNQQVGGLGLQLATGIGFQAPFPSKGGTTTTSGLGHTLTSIGQIAAGAGGVASAFPSSDRRVKTDITRVGTTDGGVPVYTFRYKAGGPMQMGVMAQDIEGSNPSAVVEIGGVKHVDYSQVS